MRNTGNTAYPVYVAEETVDAPYTVHLQLDGNAKQRPVPLVIEQKSEDSDFIKIDNLSISVLKARGYVYDKSFSADEWPKQVRITSPLPVLNGSITINDGTLEGIENRVSAIEETVPEMREEFLSKTDSLSDSVTKLEKVDENLAKLVADIIKENAALKERITAVETENTSLATRITAAETENATLRDRIAAVGTENTSLATRITAAETENATLRDRIAAVETENTSLSARITAAETENATLRDRIANIETFLSSKVFMTQE